MLYNEIMNINFTQQFNTIKTTALLLIEVESDSFVQITSRDNLGAFYANSLSVELTDPKDISLQLAHFLHTNNLALKSYRQLIKETTVEFGYVDDTPGTSSDVICLHVVADMTNQPVPAPIENVVEFVTLENFLVNLRRAGMPVGLLESAASQLIIEREVIKGDF